MRVHGNKDARETFFQACQTKLAECQKITVFDFPELEPENRLYISGLCYGCLSFARLSEGGISDYSKRYGLVIEAYSVNAEEGFEEHLLYQNGRCVLAERADCSVYDLSLYGSYEKMKAAVPDCPSEEFFRDSTVYQLGGFPNRIWLF